MRLLPLLILLAACTSSPEAKDGPDKPDPRAEDPEAWPTEIFGNDPQRPALVVAPGDYSWEEYGMLPVIVLLHGFSVNSSIQDLIFQIQTRTDEGYIAILPEGTEDPDGYQFWNATDECCDFYGSEVDDLGYLLSLLDEVEEYYPVDEDRVLFTGHSNGGYMSHVLACEAADRVAGIASLAGSTYETRKECEPSEPVSMLQMHGDLDDSVLYEGTAFYPGAVEIADRWADLNACGDPVVEASRDYVDSAVGDETEVIHYEDCSASTELWTQVGSGHVPLFNDTWRDDLLAWLLAQRR